MSFFALRSQTACKHWRQTLWIASDVALRALILKLTATFQVFFFFFFAVKKQLSISRLLLLFIYIYMKPHFTGKTMEFLNKFLLFRHFSSESWQKCFCGKLVFFKRSKMWPASYINELYVDKIFSPVTFSRIWSPFLHSKTF